MANNAQLQLQLRHQKNHAQAEVLSRNFGGRVASVTKLKIDEGNKPNNEKQQNLDLK